MNVNTITFLHDLFARCQMRGFLTFRAIHPDGDRPTLSRHVQLGDDATLKEILDHLTTANRAGWGAYLGVATREHDLGRWSRGGKSDLVELPRLGRIALQIAKQLKRPVVFTNHTQHDLYVENFPKFIQRPLQRYVARVMRTYLRASMFSTTPSEYTARRMRQTAPEVAERVQVVHNGIDLTANDHVETPVPRQQLDISPSSTVFITVGRVTPEKNLLFYAEAFLQAVQSGSDADWIIIGDGPVRGALEKQLGAIANRVHFLGAMPHPLIPAYLAIADVFATPSLSETNSLSVIEAMASGKPFIGLQADWWDEFSDHQEMGILTEHTIPAHLDAIRRFCQDRMMRQTMGVQARLASQQFDIRNVTACWLELYQGAIQDLSNH